MVRGNVSIVLPRWQAQRVGGEYFSSLLVHWAFELCPQATKGVALGWGYGLLQQLTAAIVEWSIASVAIEPWQPPSALGLPVVLLGVVSVLANPVAQDVMVRKTDREMVRRA